jgi:hypothetical protein
MKTTTVLSLSVLGLMLIAGAAGAADQPAQPTSAPVPMPGATAVTSDAFGAAGTGDTSAAPTGIDLKGYKLVWSDEFNEVSWTATNPKKSAKWFSLPSVPGKYIGYQVHDDASMVIKDGVLINTMSFKSEVDVVGSHCAGPVGMKSDAGVELITVEKLGMVKKGDKRLTCAAPAGSG